MRQARAWLCALALGASVAGTTASAVAAPTELTAQQKADAKKHYSEGETKFKAANYAGALADFQAADAIKSTPNSQRYIGLCQDNLGHYPEAVTAYEAFLANVPPKMAKEGDEIKARVAAIKAMPAKLHIETTPPGAAIMADGKALGTTPTDVELAPGKHILHVELAGYLPLDRDLDLTYGQKQDIKTELTAKPAEPVAQKEEPTTPPPTTEPVKPVEAVKTEPAKQSKLPAIITGSLAIAAIGVGTGFGIAALAKQSDFNANPNASTADTGENFALVADMAFGVAITLGVTSLVLFLTKDEDATTPPPSTPPPGSPPPPPKTSRRNPIKIFPTPFVLPGGGGAGAFLRF